MRSPCYHRKLALNRSAANACLGTHYRNHQGEFARTRHSVSRCGMGQSPDQGVSFIPLNLGSPGDRVHKLKADPSVPGKSIQLGTAMLRA